MIAIFMVDFCVVIHGEEKPAICASSALMLEEFSSGCVQPDVLSFSRAPVAPVAIIWACITTQRYMTLYHGLVMPSQGVGLSHDLVMFALSVWFEVFLQYPCGTFLVVLPFCPSQHLVP